MKAEEPTGLHRWELSKMDAGIAILASLVPENEVPAAWKKVLGENPKTNVVV